MMERPVTSRFPLGAGRLLSLLAIGAAAVVVLLFGCREEFAVDIDRNLRPDTYLTGAPAESTTSVYRLHLFWHGDDPDGKVVGYEYAITDSLPVTEDSLGYVYTTRTDSIFIFQVSGNQQVLGHRFYVRAIDNEGGVDPEPAWTFFGVVDLVPPTPIITRAVAWNPKTQEQKDIESVDEARPDTVAAGWNVGFGWTGIDGDRVIEEWGQQHTVGEVVRYEWQLVGRDIAISSGGKADTSVVYDDLKDLKYIFAVRAIDDAGFAGLDPAKRVFVWNYDPQTYFTTATSPQGTEKAHYYAKSDIWPEREFFAGDTVPLSGGQAGLALVDLRATVRGNDPDPIGDEQVSGFQYRTGAGVWQSMADSVITLENLSTMDLFLQARSTDALGRRDGTPAMLPIFINRAPHIVDTLGYEQGEPILQVPLRDQEFRLETLASQNFRLGLKFLAEDPDSSAAAFGYQWRTSGFLYEPQPAMNRVEGRIAEYTLTLPAEWRAPGTYYLGVKVSEEGSGDVKRFYESTVRFHIVE